MPRRAVMIALLLTNFCFACSTPPTKVSHMDTTRIVTFTATNEQSPSQREEKPDKVISIEVAARSSDMSDPDQRTAWEQLDYLEDSVDWFDIVEFENAEDFLVDADKTILTSSSLTLYIDTYVRRNAKVLIETSNPNGFTRRSLLAAIHDAYQRLYREEEATLTIPVIPLKERRQVLNRNETDGRFGIWGHDLRDLAVHEIHIFGDGPDTVVTLEIYS